MKTTAIALIALAPALPAAAGVIRHDVPDALYTSLASQSQFDPVGSLYRNAGADYTCSGTLVDSQWVLTAGHCALFNPSPLVFEVGGVRYHVAERVIHPGFVKSDGSDPSYDLALLRLDARVTGVAPAALYEGADDVGATMTSVGYGWTGDGVGGFIPGTEGTKRAGKNNWEQLGSALGLLDTVLFADFDSPLDPAGNLFGDPDPLDLEYLIVPGDSGGGTFIHEDGRWSLAGVHSIILGIGGDPTGMYGDAAGIVRVNQYNEWIASVIPAPATPAALAAAGVLAARRRRPGAPAPA